MSDRITCVVSDILEIPGSSFKLQIEKKNGGGVIKILRGVKLDKEIPVSKEQFTKNFAVTVIQSELFMPISPFKIMRVVEQLFTDIEKKEKEQLLKETQQLQPEATSKEPEHEVIEDHAKGGPKIKFPRRRV